MSALGGLSGLCGDESPVTPEPVLAAPAGRAVRGDGRGRVAGGRPLDQPDRDRGRGVRRLVPRVGPPHLLRRRRRRQPQAEPARPVLAGQQLSDGRRLGRHHRRPGRGREHAADAGRAGAADRSERDRVRAARPTGRRPRARAVPGPARLADRGARRDRPAPRPRHRAGALAAQLHTRRARHGARLRRGRRAGRHARLPGDPRRPAARGGRRTSGGAAVVGPFRGPRRRPGSIRGAAPGRRPRGRPHVGAGRAVRHDGPGRPRGRRRQGRERGAHRLLAPGRALRRPARQRPQRLLPVLQPGEAQPALRLRGRDGPGRARWSWWRSATSSWRTSGPGRWIARGSATRT